MLPSPFTRPLTASLVLEKEKQSKEKARPAGQPSKLIRKDAERVRGTLNK